MNNTALFTIVKYVQAGLPSRPITEQIEIYDALAALPLSENQRMSAARIAWSLKEAEQQQQDFTRALFSCSAPQPANS